MGDRYQSDDRSYRDRYGRQQEQFQSNPRQDTDRSYGQLGESWRDEYGEQQSGFESDTDYRDRLRERDFGRSDYSRGSQRRSFDTERDYSRRLRGTFGDTSTGAGSQLAASHGEWHEPSREYSDYRNTWGARSRGGNRNEPGFLERASETVASWFNDDDGYRSRSRGYRGHGPANYNRSDERVLEDACDALTEDWGVDARNIQVTVSNGDVTLDGTVPSREQKRRAEDCVDDLSGVKNVQNNLRVQERSSDTLGSQSNPTSTQA